jgi:hypothetical protein
MKTFLTFITASLLAAGAAAQNNAFGLLRFAVPGSWSEQSRANLKTYAGTEPETGIWTEIRVHSPQTAAPKPDSSFRAAWKTYITNGAAAPNFKRTFTESGLPVVYNLAFPAAVKEENVVVYKQLLIVIVDTQIQAFEMVASSEKDLKALRPFTDSFIESIDTLVKRKE